MACHSSPFMEQGNIMTVDTAKDELSFRIYSGGSSACGFSLDYEVKLKVLFVFMILKILMSYLNFLV